MLVPGAPRIRPNADPLIDVDAARAWPPPSTILFIRARGPIGELVSTQLIPPGTPAVFDLHHHLGAVAVGNAADGPAPATPAEDAAARLTYMDRHGISQCLIMPGGIPLGGSPELAAAANDAAAAYRDLHPDRFAAALGIVDLRSVEAALEEIDRGIELLDMRGFVWHHHFMGAYANDARMWPLIEHISNRGLPVFVHIICGSTLESPWRLGVLADDFPQTRFVALDGFSSPDYAQWMPHFAKQHSNIVFDTGVATSVAHGLPAFIEEVGADRLLFGSDFHTSGRLFELPVVLYELLASGIPQRDLELVLGGNAAALLGLDSHRLHHA